MNMPLLPLPRLIFGPDAYQSIAGELAFLNVSRPLLMSDRGLVRAGVVEKVARAMPETTVQFVDVPENPTTGGADAACAVYKAENCDGIVALGGGSVLDTAKFVAALAEGKVATALELLGQSQLIGPGVAPLIAVPTTVGTGSESSPASGLHPAADKRALGTRSSYFVPRVAICDPGLVRSLPPRLIAATGVDALSHCIEGFFAKPANPIIDALALDGAARAFANVRSAVTPDGEVGRSELMAAAFAGGAAIHKGLGPAHAIALACGDQHLHHGVLVAVSLPFTVELVAKHAQAKALRLANALGFKDEAGLVSGLRALNSELGLPASLREAGYKPGSIDDLVAFMVASHFNRTSPYVPTADEYRAVTEALLA